MPKHVAAGNSTVLRRAHGQAAVDCMAAIKQTQDVMLAGLPWLQPAASAGCRAAAATSVAELLSAAAAADSSPEVRLVRCQWAAQIREPAIHSFCVPHHIVSVP